MIVIRLKNEGYLLDWRAYTAYNGESGTTSMNQLIELRSEDMVGINRQKEFACTAELLSPSSCC